MNSNDLKPGLEDYRNRVSQGEQRDKVIDCQVLHPTRNIARLLGVSLNWEGELVAFEHTGFPSTS